MKNILMTILLMSVICSCGNSEQEISHPDLSQANKIKFDFKSDFDSLNRITIKSVELNDLKKVSNIKNIITYDPFTYIYCTSSGSMSFYKDSVQIITMVFNTSPDQRHIAFNYNGKLIAMKLTDADAQLLESLKN